MILDLWPLTFDLPSNVNNPSEDRVIASCRDFWHSLSSGRVGYGNTRPHPLSQVGNLALSTPGLCKLPWLSKKKKWSQTDESLSTKILNIIMNCQTMTMICETTQHQSYFDNHRSCCNQSHETFSGESTTAVRTTWPGLHRYYREKSSTIWFWYPLAMTLDSGLLVINYFMNFAREGTTMVNMHTFFAPRSIETNQIFAVKSKTSGKLQALLVSVIAKNEVLFHDQS